MRTRYVHAAAWVVLAVCAGARGGFIPGHVFISEPPDEACWEPHGYEDRIWEIDPQTGEATLFVEVPPGLCGTMWGLTFTPDGRRLRASMYETSMILELDSQANISIALDSSDGIWGPAGSNNIAYDAEGSFYVVNHNAANILRFPAGGGPGTVFADWDDGIRGLGAIGFAADGDLYYTGGWGGPGFGSQLLRITPQGEASVFDTYGMYDAPNSVTGDSAGNLYVGLSFGDILRYRAGEPTSRQVLVSGVFYQDGVSAITMSPDEAQIYAAVGWMLYGVETSTGTVELLGEFPGDGPSGMGIAVAPRARGDLNGDGQVDLNDYAIFHGCLVGPAVPVSGQCQLADFDSDRDVDLEDFALFEVAFMRP